uniref:uncharacterized protein LOC117157792 n=1 Tax=Bombus vancouverensis nearcticus TaxID=2705178 RepID=UPI00143BE5E4|nr:uncharacterized protein LOC117157792 [Bombus vancouverensis nearcticus]
MVVPRKHSNLVDSTVERCHRMVHLPVALSASKEREAERRIEDWEIEVPEVVHKETENEATEPRVFSGTPLLLLSPTATMVYERNGRMGSCWQGFNARTWVVPDRYVLTRVIRARGATYS